MSYGWLSIFVTVFAKSTGHVFPSGNLMSEETKRQLAVVNVLQHFNQLLRTFKLRCNRLEAPARKATSRGKCLDLTPRKEHLS